MDGVWGGETIVGGASDTTDFDGPRAFRGGGEHIFVSDVIADNHNEILISEQPLLQGMAFAYVEVMDLEDFFTVFETEFLLAGDRSE